MTFFSPLGMEPKWMDNISTIEWGTKLLELQLHLFKIWNRVTFFCLFYSFYHFFSSIFTQLSQMLLFFLLRILAMTWTLIQHHSKIIFHKISPRGYRYQTNRLHSTHGITKQKEQMVSNVALTDKFDLIKPLR